MKNDISISLTSKFLSDHEFIEDVAGGIHFFNNEKQAVSVTKINQEQWVKQGNKLFGSNPLKWKFKCPQCGRITTASEWIQVGASHRAIGFSCIANYEKAFRKRIGRGKSKHFDRVLRENGSTFSSHEFCLHFKYRKCNFKANARNASFPIKSPVLAITNADNEVLGYAFPFSAK